MDIAQSNYSSEGVNFVFDTKLENILISTESKKRNGEEYHIAVEYHKWANINQFMDIVNSS